MWCRFYASFNIYTCANHTQLLRTVFGAIRVNEKGDFKLTYRRFLNGIRNILETGIQNTRGWNPEYSRLDSGILGVGIRNTRVIRITLHGAIWCLYFYNWRARCKNGLSDDFGPTFTKPPNYLLSCNVTVAKWIVSCNQHIVLVIWIEFPSKLYQVTLLLARKVKLPKCQEIPIISAGGKNSSVVALGGCDFKKEKKSQTWLAAMDYLDRKSCFRNFFTLQNGKFCFTGNSQLSHLFRLATPSLPGSAS